MGKLFHDINRRLLKVYEYREATAVTFLLFEKSVGLSKLNVLLGKDDELMPDDRKELMQKVERLLQNEPIQYVVGEAEFYGLTFTVNNNVLIPRPETECLVDAVVHFVTTKADRRLNILDIGSGSGCIALALKKTIPEVNVTSIDISSKALEVAHINASKLSANVTFENVDILNAIPPTDTYDVIVSNPPYIRYTERDEMSRNVLDYEPQEALFVPNDNPLLFYKAIIKYATVALKDGGMLAFEINRLYGKEVASEMTGNGLADVNIGKDMYNNDRIVTGCLLRNR